MPRATVKPARIRLHSNDLRTDVLRGIGFQGMCSCGWRGPTREVRALARVDVAVHSAVCQR